MALLLCFSHLIKNGAVNLEIFYGNGCLVKLLNAAETKEATFKECAEMVLNLKWSQEIDYEHEILKLKLEIEEFK
jgi:hypothetical protein